jgi:hypothetical protein
MNAHDVVELLNDSIRTAKESGTVAVPIERLEAFANEVGKIVSQSQSQAPLPEAALEQYKAQLNEWVESQKRTHEWDLELFRSVITAGQAALKSSLLINGAAAVALLAFIGNLWAAKTHIPTTVVIAHAMAFYVSGVLAAAVAAGFTYLTQSGYGGEFGRHSRAIGVFSQYVSILFVVASYGLFAYASYVAYRAFTCHVG